MFVTGFRSTGAPAPTDSALSGFDALMKNSTAQSYWAMRLVAYVIDVVIVNLTLFLLATMVALPFLILAPSAIGASLIGSLSVVSGVITFLYFVVTEIAFGGSIGKRLLGLRVNAETGQLSRGSQALLRNISKIHWVLLLLDVVVGLATSKGYTQKYTDIMAKTSVVFG